MIKPPYAYSNIALYESCAAKHNYQIVLKIKPVESAQHEAAGRGLLLHELCQSYIEGHIETVPFELQQFLPVLKKLKAQGAKSEVKLACTINQEPCDYYSPDAYFRGVIDTLEVDGKNSQVGDWKSGKKNDYSNQLSFYAMLQFINSDSSNIMTRIRYLDLGISEPGIAYTRRDFDFLWTKFTRIVDRMNRDRIRSPTPSELCRFCPYNKDKMGICKW